MRILNINSKEYTFEFTMEASLYSECTERVAGLMTAYAQAEEIAENGDSADSLKNMISAIADTPKTALTMFYAGLLEHHGHEIRDISFAKSLLKDYFSEHKADESGSFYGILQIMIECMADDGFFKLIGLAQEDPTTKKAPKAPQDHKKKVKPIEK